MMIKAKIPRKMLNFGLDRNQFTMSNSRFLIDRRIISSKGPAVVCQALVFYKLFKLFYQSL